MRLIIILLLALILMCLFSYHNNSLKSSLTLSENFKYNNKGNSNLNTGWKHRNIENFQSTPGNNSVNDPTIPTYTKYQLDLYGIPKNSYDIVRNVAYIAVIPTDEVHIFRVRSNANLYESHLTDKGPGQWSSDNKVYYVGVADKYDQIHYFQCPYFPGIGERLMFYTRNTPDDPFNPDNKSKYVDSNRVDGAIPGAFKSQLACHVYYNYNWYVSNPSYFKVIAIEDMGDNIIGYKDDGSKDKSDNNTSPTSDTQSGNVIDSNMTPLYKNGQAMRTFSPGYKRLGCYKDNGADSSMREAAIGDTSNASEYELPNNFRFDYVNCREYARKMGDTMFAVKNGGKCYTWNDDSKKPNPISSGLVPENQHISDGPSLCKQGLSSLNDSQMGNIDADNIAAGYASDAAEAETSSKRLFENYTKGYLRNFEGSVKPYPKVTTLSNGDKSVSAGTYRDKLQSENHMKYIHYRTNSKNTAIDLHLTYERPDIRITGEDGWYPQSGKVYGDITGLKLRTDDENMSLFGRLYDGAKTIQPDVGSPPRLGAPAGELSETGMAYGNNLWRVYIQYQLDIGNDAKVGEQEICPDPTFLEFNPAGCEKYATTKDDCRDSMKKGFYVNEGLCQNTIEAVIQENQYNNVSFFTFINRFFSILYTFTENVEKLKKDKEKDPERYVNLTDDKLAKLLDDLNDLREMINIPYRESVENACQLIAMTHGFNPTDCSRDIPRLNFVRASGADQGDKFYSLIVNANYEFTTIPGKPSENEENRKKHKKLRVNLNANIVEFLKLGKIFVFKANELFNACSCQGVLGKKCSPC